MEFLAHSSTLINGASDNYHCGFGMMGISGMWGIGVVLWILFVVVLVLGIVLLAKALLKDSSKEDPIAILKKRYAKGEISKKEYEELKKELL